MTRRRKSALKQTSKMRTPLEDYNTWIDLKYHGFGESEDLAYSIHRLHESLGLVLNRNLNRDIEQLYQAKNIFSSVVSNFIALFKWSNEYLEKKDDDVSKTIINDLNNEQNKIEQTFNSIVFRPPTQIYPSHILHLKYLLSELPNSLLCPPLIKAWKESNENKKKFFEIFNDECIRRAGLHPAFQVFKKPIKTIASPILTPQDKRQLVMGLYSELAKNERQKDTRQENLFEGLDFEDVSGDSGEAEEEDDGSD